MTYTELVAAIQSYTENYEQEFISYIPTFIRQTETRVYNTVQVPALRANKTGILSANNKYLSAPGDFLAVYSFAVIEDYGTANETYHYLLNKDVNYIREAYPTPADTRCTAVFGPSLSTAMLFGSGSFAPLPFTGLGVPMFFIAMMTSLGFLILNTRFVPPVFFQIRCGNATFFHAFVHTLLMRFHLGLGYLLHLVHRSLLVDSHICYRCHRYQVVWCQPVVVGSRPAYRQPAPLNYPATTAWEAILQLARARVVLRLQTRHP